MAKDLDVKIKVESHWLPSYLGLVWVYDSNGRIEEIYAYNLPSGAVDLVEPGRLARLNPKLLF